MSCCFKKFNWWILQIHFAVDFTLFSVKTLSGMTISISRVYIAKDTDDLRSVQERFFFKEKHAK